MHDREMSLSEHLDELRRRLMIVVAVIGVLFLGGFFVSKPVLHWLIVRADVRHIIVTGVPEAFMALIRVDFMMALVVASPLLLYQATAFVWPGLSERERAIVGSVLGPGLGLFVVGMAVGFFIFLPLVLHVMLSFVGEGLSEYWTITNYLNFIVFLTIPFGFMAEMPLIAGILARIGLLQPSMMRRYRRYAIVIAFLIAAIVAPPDALSMTVIGLALYLIYEVSALVVRIAYRQRSQARASTPPPGPPPRA